MQTHKCPPQHKKRSNEAESRTTWPHVGVNRAVSALFGTQPQQITSARRRVVRPGSSTDLKMTVVFTRRWLRIPLWPLQSG